MTIEMKSFAISTLDDIAEGFFHARISDLPESKPCWQEIRKIRLSAAERSGRQQAANAAKQSPAEKAEKEGGPMAFFNSAITVLQTLVVALGAGLGIWGAINLLEGYGNDNPGANAHLR